MMCVYPTRYCQVTDGQVCGKDDAKKIGLNSSIQIIFWGLVGMNLFAIFFFMLEIKRPRGHLLLTKYNYITYSHKFKGLWK